MTAEVAIDRLSYDAPAVDALAAQVAAAQSVAAEVRRLLDRFSTHLSAATSDATG